MEKSALLETHYNGFVANGECRRLLLALTLLAWLLLFGSFRGVFSGVFGSFRIHTILLGSFLMRE